jgi:hypothetical protein
MIKSLRKLVADETMRYGFVGKVFQLCCKKGQLNAGVWQQLKKSIPRDETAIWKDLLTGDLYREGLQLSDLPEEWKSRARAF